MGRKRRTRRRGRGRPRWLTRRRALTTAAAALGGVGLLVGTQAYSQVSATRRSQVDVATGANAAIHLDVAPHVVADHATELAWVRNQTTHDLTFDVALDDPNQGTVSPASVTLAPDESTTFTVTVTRSGPNATVPFTVHAASGDGFTVDLPRETTVYGLTRVLEDKARNSNARYDFTYRVDGFPSFDHIRVEFRNRDKSWATKTKTSSNRRDTIRYRRGGAANSTYDVTWTLFDANGTVLLQETVTDPSDGVNPSGNEDLSTPDSPKLSSFTVTDDTKWNNTKYVVDYEVSNLDRFKRVDVTFENTEPNKDWATKTKSSSSAPTGSVSYQQGGTEGDEYEITVKVVDTDNFVVDSGTVTDVAGGNNTVSWP